MRRAWAVLLVLAAAAGAPAVVLAVRMWAPSATPQTLVQNVPTTVLITVVNTGDHSGGDEITCVRIQVPASFTISSVGVVSVYGRTSGTAYSAWKAVWPGAGVVTFKDPTDKYPLIGSSPPEDVAVFRITGTASTPGTMSWTADAADKPGGATSTGCGSGTFATRTLGFQVLTGVAATSTPSPTPAPTVGLTPPPPPLPTPAPLPTVLPLPTLWPLPTVLPLPIATVTPPPTAHPAATVAPTSRASSSPSATPTPSATLSGSTVAPTSSAPPGPSPSRPAGEGGTSAPSGIESPEPAGSALPGGSTLELPRGRRGAAALPIGGIGAAVTAALDGLPGGLVVWAYPAFTLTVPGLLLVAAIAAQAAGAASWLPLVRRRLGGFGLRRARRESS